MTTQIKITESIDLKDKIFITGFHGVGATGYIAVRHLVATLPMKRIGYLITDNLPGFISIENDALLLPYEIFQHENFIILLTRSQPSRDEINDFTKTLSEWVVKNEFKEAILIGGLDNKFKTADEKLRSVPNKAFLSKNQWEILDKGLFVTGPLALLLAYFEMEDFPACALLPYSERERPDPRASAVAIEELNKFYENFQTNTEDLIKDAQKIEDEIKNIMQSQDKEAIDSTSRGMYV
ncbi:MAG: proteasome assembly chaperone family protein [Candidatus Helarchaeota archaeon]